MGQESNILTGAGGSVEQIVQLALAAHTEIDTDTPSVALPEGAAVHSLEHLQAQPSRMRATYQTERIGDFCRYVNAEGDEDTVVFVDPRGSGAQAVIDYGQKDRPRWASHHVKLGMKHTPEFDALKIAAATKHNQRSLVEFFEDWRPFITPYVMTEDVPDTATDLSIAQAIARIRKIDIKRLFDTGHEERDWSARRSTLASVEAASGSDQPPAGFKFTCKPYPDCQQREVDVRLSIRTGGDAPVLVMRLVAESALDHEIAEEIELDITSRIDTRRVFVGSARTEQR